MRKETLDTLKAKFEGVSDAILGRIADKIAKTATTGEQAQAAVEAYTLQQLLEGYGDSRATEAQQTAVHNYESRYGLKDIINKSQIAKQYFNKSQSLFSQRLNGCTVLNKAAAFKEEEFHQLAKAFRDIARRLEAHADEIDAAKYEG